MQKKGWGGSQWQLQESIAVLVTGEYSEPTLPCIRAWSTRAPMTALITDSPLLLH